MKLQINQIVREELIKKKFEKMLELQLISDEIYKHVVEKIENEQAIVTITKQNGYIYETYKLMKKYGKLITIPIKISEQNKPEYIKSVIELEEGLFSVQLDKTDLRKVAEKIKSGKEFGLTQTSFYVEVDGEKHQFYLDGMFNDWYNVRVKNAKNIEKEKTEKIKNKIKELF